MNFEQKIIQHLCEKYHLLSIILHGSRARGMYKEQSDWDIYLLVNEKMNVSSELFEGQNLDVEAIVIPLDDDQILSAFSGRLRAAKILFDDEKNTGKNLLARAEEIYQRGFVLSEEKVADRRHFLLRRLERLRAYQDDPGVFFVHLGIFFNAALRYWFEVRQLWSEPVYASLPYILKHDPSFYVWLETLWDSRSAEEKIVAAEHIFTKLFGYNA
ncbi:MAG: nucleotidyltransferase domain-containing protein [Patescibacteria group bacterium]